MSQRLRSRWLVVASLVLAGLSSTLFNTADADPRTRSVAGVIFGEPFTGPDCDSPIGFCASGTFAGSIQGPFEGTTTRVIPSETPGYVFVDSRVVVHTREGDLFLSDAGVVNATPESSGERVILSQIAGGTGEWAGASGFLQVTGELATEPRIPARYRGRVTLP